MVEKTRHQGSIGDHFLAHILYPPFSACPLIPQPLPFFQTLLSEVCGSRLQPVLIETLPSRRGKLEALFGLPENSVPSKAAGTKGLLKHALCTKLQAGPGPWL